MTMSKNRMVHQLRRCNYRNDIQYLVDVGKDAALWQEVKNRKKRKILSFETMGSCKFYSS